MTETKAKLKDPSLRDFLNDVQKGVDKKDIEEGLLLKEKEERKNVLNLKIVVCVDISGSVSLEQYKSFMRQLNKIRGLSSVKVIETDTKVTSMYDYYKATKSRIIKLGGGGGTDFHEAMECAEKCSPDAILFFTDGFDGGSLSKSDVPCAMVLTKHGMCAYDWMTEVARVDK